MGADAVDTLAEMLERNGYRTAAVVSNYVLRRGQGFEQGFSIFDDGDIKALLTDIMQKEYSGDDGADDRRADAADDDDAQQQTEQRAEPARQAMPLDTVDERAELRREQQGDEGGDEDDAQAGDDEGDDHHEGSDDEDSPGHSRSESE